MIEHAMKFDLFDKSFNHIVLFEFSFRYFFDCHDEPSFFMLSQKDLSEFSFPQ